MNEVMLRLITVVDCTHAKAGMSRPSHMQRRAALTWRTALADEKEIK